MIRNQKYIGTSIFALSLTLAIAGCGGGPTAPKYTVPDAAALPVTGPSVPGSEQLDRNVTALLKKWNVPGMTVAIARGGKLILAKGYGYSDLEAKTSMQPDTMLRIGSTSKMLTSVATLQLVEQGRLNLDTPFLNVLTDYALPSNADSRLQLITIQMLLQHSGGWDRDKSGDPTSKVREIAKELGVPSPASCPEVIGYMLGKPLDFNPGTKFAYSNLGFCILGRVVEKISGEKYESYVRKHILTLAGDRGMYLGTTRQGLQGPHETTYYDYPGAPLVPSVFAGEGDVPAQYGGFEPEDANGAWISSSIDLLRFMSSLDGSRTSSPIGEEMIAQMVANPNLPGLGPSIWYGFGVFVGPSPDTWFHGGSLPGGQTQLYRASS
jgi:N-acyl-D-amino-acid deacylase